MSGRHHTPPSVRRHLEEKCEELIAAVPPNMVDGLRHMLSLALGRGLSHDAACDSALEALRARQKVLRPTEKAWFVLEAGCMWIQRERGHAREDADTVARAEYWINAHRRKT